MKSSEDSKYRLLLFCGVLAPIILGVVITVVGQLTPDYNQVSDSISRMGTPDRPYAWLLHGGYYVYGTLMGIAAYGLSRTIGSAPGANSLAMLLGIHAFGAMLLAVFPDSVNSIFKHIIYDIMSITSYLPLIMAMFISHRIARHELSLRVAGVLGIFIIILNLPMPVINMVSPLVSIGGLLQRLLSGCSFFWLTLTFFLLYRNYHSIEGRMKDVKVPCSPVVTEYVLPDQP
jgi:hypothetical membrane protein